MCFLQKKNTKDFILKSSLSEIHLFQDHSADDASMSRPNQDTGKEEKLKNGNCFHVLRKLDKEKEFLLGQTSETLTPTEKWIKHNRNN